MASFNFDICVKAVSIRFSIAAALFHLTLEIAASHSPLNARNVSRILRSAMRLPAARLPSTCQSTLQETAVFAHHHALLIFTHFENFSFKCFRIVKIKMRLIQPDFIKRSLFIVYLNRIFQGIEGICTFLRTHSSETEPFQRMSEFLRWPLSCEPQRHQFRHI